MSASDTTPALPVLPEGIDLDTLDPAVRQIIESQGAALAQLTEQLHATPTTRAPRATKSLMERLGAGENGALVRTPVKGLNHAAVKFVNEGNGTVSAKEMLDNFADALELNAGVTVDRSKLQMGETFVQWALALYNADEVRVLKDAIEAEAKAAAEAAEAAEAAKNAGK
jgi:HPt (histidine-containing phosphotransfer) domain-containing protein